MAYLTYNGKYIESEGKYITKTAIPGQIFFDESSYINFTSNANPNGNKTFSMDYYLQDPSSGISALFQVNNTTDFIYAVYDQVTSIEATISGQSGWRLIVQIRNANLGLIRKIYNINAYLSGIHTLQIVKTTTALTSVKIDGNTLTAAANGILDLNSANSYIIAGRNSSIFNVSIAGQNSWTGYPYGNTDGAWIDNIGTANGIITGTPGTINLF
jgi:hypothetical protein